MSIPPMRSAADRVRRLLIVVSIPVTLLMGWFLGVDWSWFREGCPDCMYDADVTEYRVFTIPVSRRVRPHPTVIQRIAADLGRPCTHPRLGRWHKHRWWGLCYCAAPCWNGLDGLDDTSAHVWYDTVEGRVREMGRADPMLGEDWHRRVLDGHDWNYWHEFARQLGAGAAESEGGDPESPATAE